MWGQSHLFQWVSIDDDESRNCPFLLLAVVMVILVLSLTDLPSGATSGLPLQNSSSNAASDSVAVAGNWEIFVLLGVGHWLRCFSIDYGFVDFSIIVLQCKFVKPLNPIFVQTTCNISSLVLCSRHSSRIYILHGYAPIYV